MPIPLLPLIGMFAQNQARETTRSSSRKQDVAAKVFFGVLLVLLSLNLLSLGLFIHRYLEILAPGKDPVRAFNSALLYYFAIDFILRFLFQSIPSRSIEPYLLLPVRKSSVVHFFLISSALTLFNALPILVFVPVGLTLMAGTAGEFGAAAWLIFIFGLILSSSYATVLAKKTALENPGLNLIGGVVVVIFMALDHAGFLPVSALSSDIFALPRELPILALGPIVLACVMYSLAYRYNRTRMTVEHLRVFSHAGASSRAGFGFLDRFGDLGTFAALELKLLLRNKRPRAQMFFALAMFPVMLAMIVYLNLLVGVYPHPDDASLRQVTRTPKLTERRVTFRCISGPVPDGATVYLSGNDLLLGNWNPDAVPMRSDSAGHWSRTILLPEGSSIEYRYTLGSRRTPMLSQDREPLPPLSLTVTRDTIVSTAVASWRIPATEAIIDFNFLYLSLLLTFLLMLSYGQFILGWESNYLDLLLSRPVDVRRYFTAKFLLLIVGGIGSYAVSLSLALVRPEFLKIVTVTAVYNLGVNSILLLFLSTYNRKRMDLTASIFGMQGKGGLQFFSIVPTLFIPIALFLILRTMASREIALFGMVGAGIAGLLLHRLFLVLIVRQFRKKRYLIAAAFRQSP